MKLTTLQRHQLIIDCQDRAKRFIDANNYVNSVWDKSLNLDEDDCERVINLARDEARTRFNLPENTDIGHEEYIGTASEFNSLILPGIKKLINRKASIADVDRLYWHAMDFYEIDLGLVIFGMPKGDYQCDASPIWDEIELMGALKIVAGLESGEHGELVFGALLNQERQASPRTAINETVQNLRAGADPMQAIRDLLGSALTTEGLQ